MTKTTQTKELPNFDNTQAAKEGWCISWCSGSADGDWQLQKNDEQAVFESDEAAWKFVMGKVREGSAYHLDALLFLAQHNPNEAQRVKEA